METLYQMLLVMAGAFSCHGLYFLSRFVLLPGKVKELVDKSGELCNKPGHAAAVVAEKIVGLYVSTVCGLSGVAILKETHHDIVFSKTSIILPCTCYIYWYFVHDLYAMYETFCFSRLGLTLVSYKEKLTKFLYHKRIFIFHHFVLLTLAIPFAQGKIINNVGDGLIGFLYVMELSTPFISLHFIFDHTSFKDSKLQQINGIAFILIFFIVRVLSIPFMYWLYANQHHNGDLLRAAQEMRWYCHGSAWTMFLIQLIWFGAAFSKVLRGARRLYSGSSTISSNKKES